MVKNRIYVIVAVLVLVAVIIGGIQAFYTSPSEEQPEKQGQGQGQAQEQEQEGGQEGGQEQMDHQDSPIAEEESLRIAQEFLEKSPTYRYDGANLKHVETKALQCQSCWVFVFEFTCRHAGYGNRSKQMLLQVITSHTAVVTVQEGKVTSAVLDDQWDVISQKIIEPV